MTVHISPTDLRVLDDGPRVQDLRLAEALGFGKLYDIRALIDRNIVELKTYGEICATVAQTPEGIFGTAPKNAEEVVATVAKTPRGRGRPGREYWLNEPQALLICMFARTENAATVRQMLIQVFVEWRRAQARAAAPQPEPAPLPPPMAALLPDGPLASALLAPEDDPAPVDLMSRLAKVREARLIFGRRAAAAIWQEMGFVLPPAPQPAQDLRVVQAGRNCLAFLLGQEGGEGNPTVSAMIEMAICNGPHAIGARDELARLGLKLVGGGMVVANSHPWLSEVLRGSEWDNGVHANVLRALPGARPDRVRWQGEGQRRGTFIPQEELDRPFLA